LDSFCALSDPRSDRNQLYPISEILLTSLCAAICGAEGWQDIEDFGLSKLDFLRTILPYENGIPSDDTFRRFFRSLDPEVFSQCFTDWFETIRPDIISSDSVLAIDGKSLRHSFDGDKKMLHMISAFCSESRLVLGQKKVSDKSNEITAIPDLLRILDVEGRTVTIDAMGCQYDIADQIQYKGGDYILALKGNQASLKDDIELYLTDSDFFKNITPEIQHDKGHSRLEKRACYVTQDIDWLHDLHPKWRSIGSLIRIDSTRNIKGEISQETRRLHDKDLSI
jgi:predicted transposase YbfD/YdcC